MAYARLVNVKLLTYTYAPYDCNWAFITPGAKPDTISTGWDMCTFPGRTVTSASAEGRVDIRTMKQEFSKKGFLRMQCKTSDVSLSKSIKSLGCDATTTNTILSNTAQRSLFHFESSTLSEQKDFSLINGLSGLYSFISIGLQGINPCLSAILAVGDWLFGIYTLEAYNKAYVDHPIQNASLMKTFNDFYGGSNIALNAAQCVSSDFDNAFDFSAKPYLARLATDSLSFDFDYTNGMQYFMWAEMVARIYPAYELGTVRHEWLASEVPRLLQPLWLSVMYLFFAPV
jgi:hypothetical protein